MSSSRHLPGLVLVLVTLSGSSAEAAEARLDVRGDPLPQGAIARLGSNRLRHQAAVFGVAFSPDGKTLATVGTDHSVHLWEVKTGRLSKTFRVGSASHCVCFTPRGDRLIVGGLDGSVRILDARTGAEKRSITGQNHHPITDLCVSADGKILLSKDSSGQAIPSDLETGVVGRPYYGSNGNRLSGAVILTGECFMALGKEGLPRKIETSSGREVQKYIPYPGERLYPEALAVSPDGKHLAVGGQKRPLVVMDLATGKVLKRFDNFADVKSVHALTFSPNGRFLAVSIPGKGVVFLGLASGKELRRLETDSYPTSVAFAPDGRTVALATGSVLVRIWDIATADDVFPGGGHQGEILNLHFTPDGKHLVSSGVRGETSLWEVDSSRELARHQFTSFNTISLQLSADGEFIHDLGNDRALRRWRLPLNGASSESTEQPTRITDPFPASLSPDGKSAVSLEQDELMLHDLTDGSKPITLADLRAVHFRLARFSPDSRRVAAVTLEGAVHVWDAATGRRLLSGGNKGMTLPHRYLTASSLSFSADGRSLLAFNGALCVYEIASGKERCTEEKTPPLRGTTHNHIICVAYSPNGRILARGNPDGSFVLVATATGAELARWQGGQGEIKALAFSPDSRRLASGGANSTILIWDVPPVARKAGALDAVTLARLWQELASDDAQQAYQAMQKLAADPARAVPFLKERLRPPPSRDAPRVARLIADLDDDSYWVREKATRELAEAGAHIEDALKKALPKAPSEEVRRRLRHLLAQLRRRGMNQDMLRLIRSVEVLDGLGTPEAIRLLRQLANASFAVDIAVEIRASLAHHPAPAREEKSSSRK